MTDLPTRLGVMRLNFNVRLVLAVCVEAVYMVLSRYIGDMQGLNYAEMEMARTPLRLVTAFLLWLLMADVIFSRAPDTRPLRHGLFASGILIMLVSQILIGGYAVPPIAATMIALASIPVAIHEEIFFRGIAQNFLMKRFGTTSGLLAATVLFILFHVGATPPTLINFVNIALLGLILGLIYVKTGSLTAVIVVHAVVDMVLCLPPLVAMPSAYWPVVVLLVATGFFIRWAMRRE